MLMLLALLGLPSRALANDGTFGGSGTNLVPLQETRISMLSEDVIATYPPAKNFLYGVGDWRVDATYVFRNPTNEVVTLQMGFPEARCDGEGDCSIDRPFRNLVTRVRGVKVKHRRGSVSLAKNYEVLGRVWLFDVTFMPGESVTVHHSYMIGGYSDLGGVRELVYITRTGALWAGPIRHARFRFRFSTVVDKTEHTTDPAPKPVRLVESKGEFYSELEYEMKDWTPTHDIYVAFWPLQLSSAGPPRTGLAPGPRCPLAVEAVSWDAFNATHDEKNRDTEVAELVEEWSQHPVERLRTCQLYVDAKFGRMFEDRRWNRYFYGARLDSPGAPPFKFFHPNPGFRPSLYGLLDEAFLEILKASIDKAEATSTSLEGHRP
jgi:hypothetical protein